MRQPPNRGLVKTVLLVLCASAFILAVPASSQASEVAGHGEDQLSVKHMTTNQVINLCEWEPMSCTRCLNEPWYCIKMVPVNIEKAGSGSGTVTSSPAGISCGLDCSEEFPEGSAVTLTAKAEEGSKFTGWSGGGCSSSGTGPCKMTLIFVYPAIYPCICLPPTVWVTATFELESRPSIDLTVSETGTGSGTVTSSPSGIDCGGTCTAEFEEGSTVKLTAAADPDSEFREWTGACSGAGVSCEVTMSEAKSVSAQFAAKRAKTLTLTKSGAGLVKSKPKGIACGTWCSSAVGQYYKDTPVLLTAKAPTGGALEGWEGCDSSTNTGLEGTCTVAMGESRNVRAAFKPAAQQLVNPQTLTLAKAGSGTGAVKGTWLTCEAACAATEVAYPGEVTEPKPKAATTVTLVAAPTLGSEFAGWEGCDSEPEGKCVVSMDEAREVTAKFE